jgi:hypothetical protein
METRADRKRGISGILMKMPLTAIVLIFEFTRVGHELSDPDFARCYRISLGVSSLCGMQNTTHLESTP